MNPYASLLLKIWWSSNDKLKYVSMKGVCGYITKFWWLDMLVHENSRSSPGVAHPIRDLSQIYPTNFISTLSQVDSISWVLYTTTKQAHPRQWIWQIGGTPTISANFVFSSGTVHSLWHSRNAQSQNSHHGFERELHVFPTLTGEYLHPNWSMHTPNTTANRVEYDATKNSVTAVSVFQADRAEVRDAIHTSL